MVIKKISLLIAGLSLSGIHTLVAQEADNSVEEINVTSSRIPIPLRQIGTSVSVMTQEEIEAHGNVTLSDVMRQMPSIATSNNGGSGKATVLRIRGEEGYRTLTILDGLRLQDPSAPQIATEFEHVMSSGIGRVEVLRGPQGLSYGADAGGVVNISSIRPDEGFNASLDAQAGRFDTRQFSGNIGGGNDTLDYFVSLADFQTDGFNTRNTDTTGEADGYDNTSLHTRVGLEASDKLRFDAVYRNVEGFNEYDGCGSSVYDCTSDFKLEAGRISADYTGETFSHSLAFSSTKTDRKNFTNGTPAFSAHGKITRVEFIGSARELPGFDLVFGFDNEEAKSTGIGRDNTGVFVEYLSDYSDSIFMTAGVRYDNNDDFGTNTSYRISGAYLIDTSSGSLKYRASYGTGFRAPSPAEIAYNSGHFSFPPASLVTLAQEASKGFEFGVEYFVGDDMHLEAVYFDQDVENDIYFDLDTFSGYLQDVGTSSSRGVELNGQLKLGVTWDLRVNYTYNNTERPNGLQRRRRPEQLANLGVSWYGLGERLNFNGFYRISKNSIDESRGVIYGLDDFEVLDLSANYRINDTIQVYGRVENVLDEDYEEIATYQTPGTSAYIGFKLNFQSF